VLLALAALFALTPLPARAQSGAIYVLAESQAPYEALAAGDGTTLFTESDDGFAELDLATLATPFSFRYFGRTYARVWVSANGGVTFVGQDSVTQQLFPLPGANTALPSGATPNALIAALWDDWVTTSRAPGGGGRVAWSLVGTAPNRRLVVDWQRLQLYGATGPTAPTYSFQLHLYERTGQWEVRLGPRVNDGAGSLLSATGAAENHAASAGVTHFGCSPACSAGNVSALANQIVSPNQNPELAIALRMESVGANGPRVAVTLRNNGQAAASGVDYRLFLSTNTTLDASDRLVYSSPAPLELGVQSTAADNSQVVEVVELAVPPELEGPFYVIGSIDPLGSIVELDRTNNVSATASTFLAGTDLTVAIAGQASGTVGDSITFNLVVRNAGVRAATGVRVRLVATSTLLEAPEELVVTAPVDVGGESTLALPVQVTLPRTFFPGSYSIGAVVDPLAVIDEISESNNEAATPLSFEVRGPDIGVVAVAAGSRTAYQGLTVPIRVTLVNRGSGRAENFRFSLFLSVNDVITLRDIKVFSSAPLSLDGNTQRVVTESARIPATTALGTYYVGIIVDAEGVILESDRSNNVRRGTDLLSVTAAVPDLTATSLVVAPRVAAGEYMRASALLANVGADLATDAAFEFYLSTNDTISRADIKIGEGLVSLEAGDQRVVSADLLVPSFLSPGRYAVGLVVDPAGRVAEANEGDNTAIALNAVEVVEASVGVATSTLPDGVSGVPYEVRLAGRGGDGTYAWSISGGALPEGLSLSPAGVISGTPRAQGTSAVVVRVASAGGTADRAFTLGVRAYASSLGLLDVRLPAGRRGTPYSAPLGAVGGNPPYRFRLASGDMPAGLTFSPGGLVSGLPTQAGDYSLAVLVEDNAGHRAAGSVALEILSETGSLVFRPQRLVEPEAGRAYTSGRLNVSGGVPPYAAALLDGALPAGMSLQVDPGGASVSLVGTPTAPGVSGFTVVVSDSRGERGLGHFVLRVNPRPLTFVTTVLPAASPGSSYGPFPLESNARPPVTYSLVGGELPPGLTLSRSGVISGTTEAAAPRRIHAFAVRVEDQSGGELVAPFSIDVPPPPQRLPAEEGCSSTGVSGLLPLALAALLSGRGRRKAASGSGVVLAGLALALAASPASALYRVSRSGETYVNLAGGTPLFETPTETAAATPAQRGVSVPFGFRYFGALQANVSVGVNGYLVFGAAADSSANTKIPSPGGVANFIAPFWDDLRLAASTAGGGSLISTKVEGATPNRVFTIEWRNMQRNAAAQSGPAWSAYSFQVRLYETSNEISLHYGGAGATAGQAPLLSASMGVVNGAGDAGFELSDSNCSPGCTAANFPVNTVVRLRLAPDLVVPAVSAPATLFAGVSASFRATLRNLGGVNASGVKVRYLLSTDTLVDGTDTLLGELTTSEVATASPNILSSVFTGPTELPPGRYQLLVIADPDDALPEVNEDNNEAVALPIGLAPRAPDFVVTRLLGAAAAAPGQPYLLTRSIRNQGNGAGAFTWSVVLSSNNLATGADLELARGAGSLEPNGVLDATSEIAVPAGVVPGRYWLGLLVRPAEGVAEIDALNNDRVLGPISLRGGQFALSTTALPEVVAGVPFSLQLTAEGGSGEYQWSQGFPTLPGGVILSERGVISGVLDSAGEYRFQVQCLSGGTIASAFFTLVAVGQSTPLAVVSRRLPLGVLGAPYAGALAAHGGRPPYSWSLEGAGALPDGLVLGSDGAVEGVPLVDGLHPFEVEVRDSAGAAATGEVVLALAGPTRPVLSTLELAPGRLGESYAVQLTAAGGAGPYTFSLPAETTRRLPTTPFEACDAQLDPCSYFGGPPGLELSESGLLTGTPQRVGVYSVTVKVTDSGSNEDTATYLFAVTSVSSLSIRTGTLPDAVVGSDYSAALAVEGATGRVVWSASLLEGAQLPAGLSFGADGRLAGRAVSVESASFLAVARDEAGRLAVRPLAIRVVAAPLPAEKRGCDQTGSAGGFALLLAAGLLLGRRRRATWVSARAGVLALALAALPSFTACRTEQVPCDGRCEAPFTCDPLDGLCKCGGQGGAICPADQTCDVVTKACLVPGCVETCPPPLVCGTDGRCRCGSPTGEVCVAGSQTCSTVGRCARTDPCAEVSCTVGTACDPGSGRCVCGLGGETCVAGQRCVDGVCLSTSCSGVTCTGGTSCDPADGLCKCGGEGGALCVNGEACDTINARCLRSSRCEGVTCIAGASCDPLDGKCYCGGPGGPTCAGDQSCDPVGRRCIGGDPCARVTCGAGFRCDVEDGLCKCGGLGGLLCAAGQICINGAARSACETPCDPFSSACGDARACRYDETAFQTYCVVGGPGGAGQECDAESPCGDGLHCRLDGARGACRPYCLSTDACGAGESCRPFRSGSPLGLCLPLQ
jgi:uncharacterized protein (TIGR03382 family)